MKPKTPAGPEHGELVLFCEHLDVSPEHIHLCAGKAHWFYSRGLKVRREKREFTIEWICVCPECYATDVVMRDTFQGQHVRWIGPPPDITAPQGN